MIEIHKNLEINFEKKNKHEYETIYSQNERMKECFRVCRLQESYDMKKRNCFHLHMQKLFIVSPGTFELRCFRRRVIVSKVRLQSTRAQILNIRFWKEVQKNVKLKRFEH